MSPVLSSDFVEIFVIWAASTFGEPDVGKVDNCVGGVDFEVLLILGGKLLEGNLELEEAAEGTADWEDAAGGDADARPRPGIADTAGLTVPGDRDTG